MGRVPDRGPQSDRGLGWQPKEGHADYGDGVIELELSAKTLGNFNMPGIRPLQYVDGILVYGFDRDRVREAGRRLWDVLEPDGWLCRPKSRLETSTAIDWMRKKLDGPAWSMQSSAGYVASMVTMWIKLAALHMSLHRFASYVQIAGDFKWKMPRNVLGYT